MHVTPEWKPEAIRFETDPGSGTEVEQLTSEPVTSTNIYCEQRYASADGARIALSRKPFNGPGEIWVCDLRSLRLCRAAVGSPTGANARLNAVYYVAPDRDPVRLMRLDLASLETRELARFDPPAPGSVAVSPDERWLVSGAYPALGKENVYRLRRTDLATGRTEDLCEVEDMFNPHLQVEPGGGRLVNVQINRGGRRDRATGRLRLAGDLGATLAVVDAETGAFTPLPAGRPHTPPISGHECWAGTCGRLLFTAGQYQVSASAFVTLRDPPAAERDMPAAAIFSVAPGDPRAAVVASDRLYNHLACSDDGRFFIADDHASGVIFAGSLATGRSLPLCDSHTRQGTCQYSHAHAYMTPDNRHVIFNSIATGVAQVYAARVPDGFLDRVLAL